DVGPLERDLLARESRLAGDRRGRRPHLRRRQGVGADAHARAGGEPDWRPGADKIWHSSAANGPPAATRLLTPDTPPRAFPRTCETRLMAVSILLANEKVERGRVRRAW